MAGDTFWGFARRSVDLWDGYLGIRFAGLEIVPLRMPSAIAQVAAATGEGVFASYAVRHHLRRM